VQATESAHVMEGHRSVDESTVKRCAIPSLERGLKTHQKHSTFPPSKTEIIKILDFTGRGKSNNIAHRPIIQVFMVPLFNPRGPGAHMHWDQYVQYGRLVGH